MNTYAMIPRKCNTNFCSIKTWLSYKTACQLWHGHWADSGNEKHILGMVRYISGNKNIELKKKKRLCGNILWLVDIFGDGKDSERKLGHVFEESVYI